MNRRIGDLIILASLAIAAMLLTQFKIGNDWLLAPMAFLIVLFVPGYSLTVVLFPRPSLFFQERFLLSLGLSVAITILGGVLLNFTPEGLQSESWTLWLGGITLIACCAAVFRRPKLPESANPRSDFAISLDRGIFVVVVILGIMVALGIATSSALQQKSTTFTQLWILPGTAENSGTVRLGVNNMESTAMQYRLKLESGGQLMGEWQPIILDPGELWETMVEAPYTADQPLTATLYWLDEPEAPYRQVFLWGTPELPGR